MVSPLRSEGIDRYSFQDSSVQVCTNDGWNQPVLFQMAQLMCNAACGMWLSVIVVARWYVVA